MGIKLFELYTCNISFSVLHSEMEVLLWTSLCMKDMKILMIRFETDWSDLLDMTKSSMGYQAFASEIDIFPILHDNQLAKEIKIRSFIYFFYRSNMVR